MTDSVVVEEVVPGSPGDPFTAQASDPATAPSPSPAGGEGAAPAVVTEPGKDGTPAAGDPASSTVVVDPDADEVLSPEEEEAISVLVEQIRTEVRSEELPKVQSAYDRRIQSLERSANAAAQAATLREQALQAQVREAQLNGLSDAEKERLRSEWSLEDERAKLDAYRVEVEAYHKEVYIAECVAQFGTELGITAEDLGDFNSPEEIEAFVKDTALAHYRDLAAGRSDAPATPATPATVAKPAPAATAAPAGSDAPSDGGGGAAVPQVAKFDPRPGKEAMAANIANGGWETVRVG